MAPFFDDLFAAFDSDIQRTGARLGLMAYSMPENEMRDAEPLASILRLAPVAHGGVDPYLYATSPNLDAIMYKGSPRDLFPPHPGRFIHRTLECAGTQPDCPPLLMQFEAYALWGAYFEDVILVTEHRGLAESISRERLCLGFCAGTGERVASSGL